MHELLGTLRSGIFNHTAASCKHPTDHRRPCIIHFAGDQHFALYGALLMILTMTYAREHQLMRSLGAHSTLWVLATTRAPHSPSLRVHTSTTLGKSCLLFLRHPTTVLCTLHSPPDETGSATCLHNRRLKEKCVEDRTMSCQNLGGRLTEASEAQNE